MALSRILVAWVVVFAWLLAWNAVASRLGRGPGPGVLSRLWLGAGEALLLTLLGALWFGTLGAGAWWLVFALVGAIREWPPASAAPRPQRRDRSEIAGRALGVVRIVAAGGWLAWRLGPA